MWKNNLEKFEFNMDTIELFDSFAGIGALHKSLTKLRVPINLKCMSEVDPDSIIDYAAIHLPEFEQNKDFNCLSYHSPFNKNFILYYVTL